MRGAARVVAVGLLIHRKTLPMLGMLDGRSCYQHRRVKENLHRILPRLRRSRSSRTLRIVLFTVAVLSGTPESKTQTPCFLYIRPFPLAGRKMMRSSELSNSRKSPGASCNSSRTGLGSTTRPALSTVSVVTIMAFYHSWCHLQCH